MEYILTPDDSVKIEVGQATNLTNHASSRALHLIRANEFLDVTQHKGAREFKGRRIRDSFL